MPLLRLVHALERRRPGRSFALTLTVRRPAVKGQSTVVATSRVTGAGPRAFVVGTGDRVDIAVGGDASPLPGGMASQADGILPRHLAVVVVPLPNGTLLRAMSLHPERGFAVLGAPGTDVPGVEAVERLETPVGCVIAWNALRLVFGGYILDIVVEGAGAEDVLEVLPVGMQLAFHNGSQLKAVGGSVAGIAGPALDRAGGGGHIIPALVHAHDDGAIDGALVLRARTGVIRVDVPLDDLLRGVLIGRSRRCTLGRGFDENDGLSRVHALVIGLDEPGAVGVFAFDLASRYGLRDVSRPSRLVPMARLDDGIGCLVYGAGYLTWEMS